MKRSSTLIFCASLICLLASCKSCQRMETQAPLYIYTFEQTASFNMDSTKGLIERMTGEKDLTNLIKSDENKVYFTSNTDLNTNLEHDLNTGNFTYNKGLGKYLNNYVPKLPSSKEAQKIVDDFLSAQKLAPRNQAEFKLLHEGGWRSTTTDGKNQGVVVDKILKLTYGRVLDSLPVIGSGSKIIVKVGENGEILGMIRRWRELNLSTKKQLERAEMNNQETAESLAKQQIVSEFGAQSTFTIKSVSKAYYDNNGNILQPVYAFETVITLNDKNIPPINYLCVIPLLKNSPEPLNLTKIDGRAKELIKNVQRGQKDSTDIIRKRSNE